MPAFKFQVADLVVFELKKDQTYLDIAKSKIKDKMSRGTYKSKEKHFDKRRLFYQGLINDKHCFSDGTYQVYAHVSYKPHLTITFEALDAFDCMWLYLNAKPQEKLYGCGQQFTKLDLKGETIPLWVSEHHSLKKLLSKHLRERFKGVNYDYLGKDKVEASYHAQPTFMSSLKYAVHLDLSAYGTVEFKPNQTVLYFRQIPKTIHFFKADSFLALAKQLNHHLGLQPRLPDWTSEGAILALQGGLKRLEEKLKVAQKAGVKVKALWAQDWSGQVITKFGDQVYWHWALDERRYGNLKEKISAWQKKDIYFLGYINPFLKENSPQFNEAHALGYLVLNASKRPYLMKSTTFKAGLIDLTNPDAYQYYKTLIKKQMMDLGMAGWMADFGEYLPTDALLHRGEAKLVHNHYPELWAQCHQEAINEHKNKAFIFTRAAYSKTIKHTNAMWVGDQHVDFSDQYGLGSVIPAYLSMAISGVGINHSDTGGYTTIFHMKRSRELFIRWAEMNVFSPLFRTHEGNAPTKNAQFDDPDIIKPFARLTKLYADLSSYHKYVREQYYEEAIPTIRPMFYHFDEAFAHTNKRQYMYGDALLVCPVVRAGIKTQTVTLPKGTWIHLITKTVYEGGSHEINAPLGIPTVFYLKTSKFKTYFDTITMEKED